MSSQIPSTFAACTNQEERVAFITSYPNEALSELAFEYSRALRMHQQALDAAAALPQRERDLEAARRRLLEVAVAVSK